MQKLMEDGLNEYPGGSKFDSELKRMEDKMESLENHPGAKGK